MQYFVKEKDLITFEYGGVSSAFYHLYVVKQNGLYDSFQRDLEFIEVKGRDGDLVIDNKRRRSKTISLECFIDLEKSELPLETLAENIEEWLQGEVAYKNLSFSNNVKIFKAICVNNLSINEVVKNVVDVQIRFKIQPS